MGTYLTGVHLMGVHLMGIYLTGCAFHGRASHRRVCRRHASLINVYLVILGGSYSSDFGNLVLSPTVPMSRRKLFSPYAAKGALARLSQSAHRRHLSLILATARNLNLTKSARDPRSCAVQGDAAFQ